MSEFKVFTFASVFITLYFVFMVPLGGADIFTNQDFNVSEEDLTIQPDLPSGQFRELDISKDIYDSDNIKVVDTQNYFNGSQEFNTDKSIVLENSNSSGYVSYNIPDAEVVKTLTQKESALIYSRSVLWQGNISGNCTDNLDRCTELKGESSISLDENTNIVTVQLREESDGFIQPEDPVLYDISYSETEELGILETVTAYFNSAFNYLLALLSITAEMPFYIAIPFGLYFGYLLVKILSFL